MFVGIPNLRPFPCTIISSISMVYLGLRTWPLGPPNFLPHVIHSFYYADIGSYIHGLDECPFRLVLKSRFYCLIFHSAYLIYILFFQILWQYDFAHTYSFDTVMFAWHHYRYLCSRVPFLSTRPGSSRKRWVSWSRRVVKIEFCNLNFRICRINFVNSHLGFFLWVKIDSKFK